MAETSRDRPGAAAFELIAEQRLAAASAWPSSRRRAGVPLARVYAELPDRRAAAGAAGPSARRLAMLGDRAGRAGRHDAARAGVRAGHAPARRDGAVQARPSRRSADEAAARSGPAGRQPCAMSAGWAAGCSTPPGPDGRLRAPRSRGPVLAAGLRARLQGLAATTTRRTWQRTLAELDRRLQQAERLAGWVHGLRRGRGEPSGAAAAS